MKEKYLKYSIFNPTGNITALVESFIEPDKILLAADEIMRLHPEVEQVGFVRFPESFDPACDIILHMAGGEFCGNASMCAAAFLLLNDGNRFGSGAEQIDVNVICAGQSVPVSLRPEAGKCFQASIQMPEAIMISEERFQFEYMQGDLPVVHLDGISHIIIEPGSVFWKLKSDRNAAEHAVRNWCRKLGTQGLGLLFIESTALGVDKGSRENSLPVPDMGFFHNHGINCPVAYDFLPLVFVPGADTMVWEKSCASGSAALGM